MPELTVKQRTKVNAALAYLHDGGWQVDRVIETAKSMIAKGQSAVHAYEAAFAGFLRVTPAVRSDLAKITRLIEASDDATVAQYDAALSAYIATGDDAALEAITPTVAADAVQLAIERGEVDADTVAAHPDNWGDFAREVAPLSPGLSFDTGAESGAEQPKEGVFDATGYSVAKADPRWQEAYAAVGMAAPGEAG